MNLLDNPIDFFEEIDRIAEKTADIIQENSSEDNYNYWEYISVVFPLDDIIEKDGKVYPIFNSLSIKRIPVHADNDDELYTEYIDYSIFFKTSIDNKDYTLKPSKEIAAIYENWEETKDVKFYICDVTNSFYCIIDDNNKEYFFNKYTQRLRNSIAGNSFGEEIPCYYITVNPSFFVQFWKMDEDFLKACRNIKTLKLFTFELNREEYHYKFEDIDLRKKFNIYPEMDDVNDYRPYSGNISKLNFDAIKTIEAVEKEGLSIFGEKINDFTLYKTRKYDMLSSITAAENKLFFETDSEQFITLSRRIKDIFDKIVDDFTSKFNSVDEMVDAVNNIVKEHHISSGICRLETSNALKENQKNLLVYENYKKYKYLGNEGIKEVTLFDEICKELPIMLYLDDYFDVLSESIDKYNQTREDIDNFEPIVGGGGFGIGGALKGMLTAAVINSVAQAAYESYKNKQLNKENYTNIFKEFCRSEPSLIFIKELIRFDFVFIIYKLIDNTVCCCREICDKHGEIGALSTSLNFAGLFSSYNKAWKMCAIALSKHLKLNLIPVYEDLEDIYQLSELGIMEKAILEFPFSKLFYEKYIEMGGEMSNELKQYATLNRVDLTDIYEREKERVLAEQKEKAEKERLEKERLEKEKRERDKIEKIKAEEKRKYDEKVAKAKEKMAETFGCDLVNQYPDLFFALSENPIFIENCNTEFKSIKEISDAVFSYINKNYKSVQTNLISNVDATFSKKINNVSTIYGANKVNYESVLFIFDNTVFGSAKDGFVMAKNYFCFRNMLGAPNVLSIKDIKKIKTDSVNTIINDTLKVETTLCKIGANEVVNILIFCICNLLKLNSSDTQGIEAPIITSQNDIKGWKCQCGNINDVNSKFCGECGTKKTEKPQDWICPNCNTKNPINSKFCGECGEPKAKSLTSADKLNSSTNEESND